MSPSPARLADASVPIEEVPQELVFATVCRRTEECPDSPAVIDTSRRWSYRELWEASGDLTACFRPREIVAVTGQSSFGLVAAVLAAMRRGAVLLLVDPALPIERRRRMLRDANTSVLVVVDDSGAHDLVEVGIPAQRISTSAQLRTPAPYSPAAPDESPRIDDPAYIFFTSGSTGRPKGILGCQKGLAHFLAWQRDAFQARPGDRVAQLTSLSFDVVLRDIFLPLTSGGAVCIPDPDERVEALAWLDRLRITILHVTPSLADSWTAGVVAAVLPALRCTFFAGEPLTETVVRRWRAVAPQCAIVNLYGPTETTLVKCFYVVPAAPEPGLQPVGEPIPGSQALVLSPDGVPCSPGEAGEIVIRTPYRTLGYLRPEDDPEHRFRPNPFRDDPHDVIYRTGDRGRYRSDGRLEFMGRLDDQVKIMGVRVEPAESAAVLLRHPRVRSCFVLGRRMRGEVRLVAYVVPHTGDAPAAAELRAFASLSLHPAMVPSHYVLLPRLPLLPNGKVDRMALAAPEFDSAERNAAEPRNAVEQKIREIWAGVLRAGPAGLNENFFLAGGDSLKAIRLVAALGRALGLRLPVRILFDHPTIAELSETILARLRDDHDLPAEVFISTQAQG